MANYFPVALTKTAQSRLMNLPDGSLTSWQELCRQFMTNFETAYSRPGNETNLHTAQQRPGESLRSFIQRFPRFATPFLISPMLLWWLHFARV
jgi:hypothetical protein